MIRINLLTTERKTAKAAASKSFSSAGPGQKMMVLGSLILVVVIAGLGWRYWALGQMAAQLEARIEEARREEARLQDHQGQTFAQRGQDEDIHGPVERSQVLQGAQKPDPSLQAAPEEEPTKIAYCFARSRVAR